jgi:membrane protein DedA with SNARE-associated domain
MAAQGYRMCTLQRVDSRPWLCRPPRGAHPGRAANSPRGVTVSEILGSLGAWIQNIIVTLGYPGIFLIMLVENLFPPIPSELVMPFAGFAAGQGRMDFWAAVAAGTLGSVVGAIILYYVGQLAGEPLLRVFLRRYGRIWMLSEADLDRSLAFFNRYGYWVVFTARVIPVLRSLISIPAGMGRMPLLPFLALTIVGSAVWTLLLTYAGLVLGENWELVLDWIKQYQRLVIVVLVLAVVVFGWRWFVVRRRELAGAGSAR